MAYLLINPGIINLALVRLLKRGKIYIYEQNSKLTQLVFTKFRSLLKFLKIDAFEYDLKAIKKWWKQASVPDMLQKLRDTIAALETFDLENIESAIWAYTDENGIKRIQAMQPLRIALTGLSFGPGLFEIPMDEPGMGGNDSMRHGGSEGQGEHSGPGGPGGRNDPSHHGGAQGQGQGDGGMPSKGGGR